MAGYCMKVAVFFRAIGTDHWLKVGDLFGFAGQQVHKTKRDD
jgi:hypothetical protein